MSERSLAPEVDEDGMKAEYDFTYAIPNPYARLAQNGPLILLEPDVLEAFPDSEAVNAALRLLIRAAKTVFPDPGMELSKGS